MRLRLGLVFILAATAHAAEASLLQTSPFISTGSGIGGVNTVLTVQGTPSESGCVAWNGSSDVVGPAACPGGVAGGDEKAGASLTLTRSLSELGITNAADLRIVLNVSEPGANSITLNLLVLRIYDAVTGAVLFTSSTTGPIIFPSTATGTGTSGFVFHIDAAQAAAAQPFFTNQNNRVGLAVALSDSAGGNETLYVANAPAVTLCPGISLAPPTLPAATAGVAFSQQLTASGGAAPYTFALVDGALPSGFTLSSSGLISGLPGAGAVGTYIFTVRVTDNNGCTVEQLYQLVVTAAGCPIIAIAPLALPAATIGGAYSQQLTASGGTAPYTFTLLTGALPSGLTLSAGGVISGTPAAGTDGSHVFTVRATDANGCTRDQPLELVAAAPVPVMPPTFLVVLALLLFAIAVRVMQRDRVLR